MKFFVNALDYLLSSKKTLIYTTFNLKDYYRVVANLKADSIQYRVASTALPQRDMTSSYGNEYMFYVKESDKNLAGRALNKKQDR